MAADVDIKRPVRLTGPAQRALARLIVGLAPDGWIVRVSEPTRNLEQNARMWVMLGDIARAEPMGRKHTPDDWKAIFMRACGWEVAFLPGLGEGDFFPVGFRSSHLTVREMAQLITFIRAWGDEQGIEWSEPNPWAA